MRVFRSRQDSKAWGARVAVVKPDAGGAAAGGGAGTGHAGAAAASPNTCQMRAQPSLDDLIFALVRRFGFLPLPGKNGTDTTGSDALFNVSNTYCRQNGHTL